MAPFQLGVNYWPHSSAMAMWSRFDPGEIGEDFARIAGLGLRVVRFFLTWETFQPQPYEVDGTALRRLDAVLEAARAHGLQTMPTLFTGHMSGVNWLPEWTLDRSRPAGRFRTISGGRDVPAGAGDLYRGPLLDAQRYFARALGARYRAHAAICRLGPRQRVFQPARAVVTAGGRRVERARWRATSTKRRGCR